MGVNSNNLVAVPAVNPGSAANCDPAQRGAPIAHPRCGSNREQPATIPNRWCF